MSEAERETQNAELASEAPGTTLHSSGTTAPIKQEPLEAASKQDSDSGSAASSTGSQAQNSARRKRRLQRQEASQQEAQPGPSTPGTSYVNRAFESGPAPDESDFVEEDISPDRPPRTIEKASNPFDTVEQPQELPVVFVQQGKSFRKYKRQQYELFLNELKRRNASVDPEKEGEFDDLTIESGVPPALVLQRGFMVICLAVQGMLPGFAVFHCIALFFFLRGIDEWMGYFLQLYADKAMFLHTFYYVAITLCVIGTLDRYDVTSGSGRMLLRALTFQSAALSIIFYLIALLFTLSTVPIEHRMDLYSSNQTLWYTSTGPNMELKSGIKAEVSYFRTAAVIRAACLTIAWFMISVHPSTDLTSKHLRACMRDFAENLAIQTRHKRSNTDSSNEENPENIAQTSFTETTKD